jgi:diadenosine tetraphosphate (Ap4A) HIT family hydrolase
MGSQRRIVLTRPNFGLQSEKSRQTTPVRRPALLTAIRRPGDVSGRLPRFAVAPALTDPNDLMSTPPDTSPDYFCRVVKGDADPFIFENRAFVAIFDTNPVNPGHALVIPRRHVVSIFDLDETEQAAYFDAIKGVKRVIESTDLKGLYVEMLTRDYLQDRPQDHIETVLGLPFLGQQPDAYTVGNNDGRAAGRSIDHLHVILLPRFVGDVENPRGGIRNVIPSRANYQRR